MKKLKYCLFILCLLFCLGCSRILPEINLLNPPKTTSRYFETFVATFDDTETLFYSGSKYFLVLNVKQAIMSGATLEANFENPQDKGKPFVTTTWVSPTNSEVAIKSPLIQGFKEGVNYKVIIKAYQGMVKKKLLGKHVQFAKFTNKKEKNKRLEELREKVETEKFN